jgi:DNA-binding CsgD family transcriptional regulator
LSAHLSSAIRLRGRTGAPQAVLSPAGEVLHAEGAADERSARQLLASAALDIARARREEAVDPDRGLAFWRAMIDGRWTLVERCDTDGRRFVLARGNEPDAIAAHALDAKERAVLERASLGSSLAYIAYELGIPDSTVSDCLRRSFDKLGIRSRAELMELRASLVRG